MRKSLLEAAKSAVWFCRRFSAASFLWTRSCTCIWSDRFSAECDQTGRNISTRKSEVLHICRFPSQFTLHVSGKTLQKMEQFNTLWCTHGSWKNEKGDWYVRCWSKCNSAWALSSCGHKSRAFKLCKAVSGHEKWTKESAHVFQLLAILLQNISKFFFFSLGVKVKYVSPEQSRDL